MGPLHIIQGYQNVSKCRPRHSCDLYNKGKQLRASFSYMGQNVKKPFMFGYLMCVCGGGGAVMASMIRLGLFGFPAILSPISMIMSNKETI